MKKSMGVWRERDQEGKGLMNLRIKRNKTVLWFRLFYWFHRFLYLKRARPVLWTEFAGLPPFSSSSLPPNPQPPRKTCTHQAPETVHPLSWPRVTHAGLAFRLHQGEKLLPVKGHRLMRLLKRGFKSQALRAKRAPFRKDL